MARKPAVRKLTLSPTRLRILSECPMQYRLEYVEKLGRFYHRARAGFSFGHSLHRTLETFHAAGGAANVSVDDVAQSLSDAWVAQGYQSPEQEAQFKAEAAQIVASYHAADAERLAAQPIDAPPAPSTLFTEKTLRQELSPDIVLSGRVDRIDEHHDGALEIVDYKSGRRSVTDEDVAGSRALGIYQALLKHLFPERRVFATLVALRTGASGSHEQTPDERADLLAEALEDGITIRDKDWESVLPAPCDHCPHCDFLPHCSRYFRSHGIRLEVAGSREQEAGESRDNPVEE